MLKLTKQRADARKLEEQFYSIRLVQTSHKIRRMTIWLEVILGVCIVFMFLPWTQTIRGNGKVIALDPADRPQEIQAVIGGSIAAWHVQEGDYVEKGDTLIELREVKDKFMDPLLILRLEQQLKAKQEGMEAYGMKISALENQILALQEGLSLKQKQTYNKLQQAQMKVTSDSAAYIAAGIDAKIAGEQLERMRALYNKQLEPLVKLEERQNKYQSALAKKTEAENKLLTSRSEVLNAWLEQSSVMADYSDKIAKARSERSTAAAALSDAQAMFAKLNTEISGNKIRAGYYYITAPQDGYVVKALKAGVGEQIKEGEGICTIMPDNPGLAAEIYVKAMDVPLITKGRKVRLQFDGWPAIQFSGWPSVAIGTFGAQVHVIDYVNSPGGFYRLIVTMDTTYDEPWPPALRVGSGVYAWAMLEDVPVIYELWRQLNGFPPALQNVPEEQAKPVKKLTSPSSYAEEKEE